jgi:hypothetical protein
VVNITGFCRVIEYSFLVYPSSDFKTYYKYNEKGHLIAQLEEDYAGKSVKSSFEYTKFDKYGNWLYMIQREPTMSITEREMVYY